MTSSAPVDLELLDRCLEAIETVESASLAWGYVDGSLSESEVSKGLERALMGTAFADDYSAVLDALVDHQLVRTWREDRERRYRTRFAELLRLLVHSRQWFRGRPWQTAASLVADFRFDVRRRGYPLRVIGKSEAWDEVARAGSLSEQHRSVWNAMLSPEAKLARFQLDATKRLVIRGGESGTIITAGTGSGKTMAFYLPALLSMSADLSPLRYVKALAIYPRQELLKDQLTEALKLSTRVGGVLKGSSKRVVSLGAYFGGAPRSSQEKDLADNGWTKRTGGAFLCPLVRCPNCGGDMLWTHQHRTSNAEVLSCSVPSCGTETLPGSLLLTRQSIVRTPPDLLFTTTEMINQRLSDVDARHLFGVGKPYGQRLQYVLLDEVHTFEGQSGAQTGVLLRRLRHLLGSPITWVGLSATLRDAEQFFSSLTGLRPDQVVEITPQLADMIYEGAEYQVVLRTDPSSQASTLSTSIQTLMLLSRMLDGGASANSLGRFGKRVFAFTDDLDATNRLFDNFRDAEAYDRFGRPDQQRAPLAALRLTGESDDALREASGQRWAFAEELRGSLSDRIRVGRTSSRDQGVDMSADVVVATSSLEVGFNDPDVGAVVQHKAPRGVASFLQRKGRAGRVRGMRPITITVLSDYGRDREAFQNFERLFDPVVPRQLLPVRNTYILRMQAGYALMDWIAHKAAQAGAGGWAWSTLSKPESEGSRATNFLKVARKLIQRLAQVDEATVSEFGEYLRSALQIDESTVQLLLWDPPRAVLTEVIPTLARRLFRDWELATKNGMDLCMPYHPLPDFVPRALFSELNLPEIQIDLPPSRDGEERKRETMPALQALQQFVPGRVRRRFADDYGGLAHWVPVSDDSANATIYIEAYAPEREFVDSYPGIYGGKPCILPVFRPWVIEAAKAKEAEVLPTSNSRWDWQSNFDFRGRPLTLETPATLNWRRFIPQANFYLHRFGGALSIARHASEGLAEVRRRSGATLVRFQLRDNNEAPVAVGFAYEGDGVVLPLSLPALKLEQLNSISLDTHRWLRTQRLRNAIFTDTILPVELNEFQRDWLFVASLLAGLVRAENDRTSLSIALTKVLLRNDASEVRSAIQKLLNAADVSDCADETRLETGLYAHLDKGAVCQRIRDLLVDALDETGSDWMMWLERCLRETLTEAILQACVIAAPENTAIEGLTAELVADEDGAGYRIVIAETTIGGGGTLEVLAHGFALEPQSFFRALEAALSPSDLELSAEGLSKVVRKAVPDSSVERALNKVRTATDHATRNLAKQALFGELAAQGIAIDHSLSVAIATRLLRTGASSQSDEVLRVAIQARDFISARYGLGLPSRIVPVLITTTSEAVRHAVASLGGGGQNAAPIAELLLWPESGELRASSLRSYNPFRRDRVTDAALVRDLLVSDTETVSVEISDDNWKEDARRALSARGRVRVRASIGSEGRLRQCLIPVLAEPISSGYLQFYASLESVASNPGEGVVAELLLREQV